MKSKAIGISLVVIAIIGVTIIFLWDKIRVYFGGESGTGSGEETESGIKGYVDRQIEVWHSTAESHHLSDNELRQAQHFYSTLSFPVDMKGFYILDFWRCDKYSMGKPRYSHFYFQITKHPTTTKADITGQLKTLDLAFDRLFMKVYEHKPLGKHYQGLYGCVEGNLMP